MDTGQWYGDKGLWHPGEVASAGEVRAVLLPTGVLLLPELVQSWVWAGRVPTNMQGRKGSISLLPWLRG